MSGVETRTPSALGRPPAASRRTLILLCALAVLPYVNALHNELVYDDHAVVTENRLVRSLDPRRLLEPSLDRYVVEWYRPLTIYSLAVNYRLHGLEPFGYHAANVLLHVANVWLLYGIAARVLGSPGAALAAAGLFAVHAIHVEAVTPASGRADLLATLFVLIAWRLALAGDRPPTWRRAWAIAAAAFAGLLSKESAIVTWPLVALSDIAGVGWKSPAGPGPLARLSSHARIHIALAVAVGTYFVLRIAVTGGIANASDIAIRAIENPLAAVAFPVRVVTAVWVLIKYCALLLVPVGLSADYSFDQIPAVASWRDPRIVPIVLCAGGLFWAVLVAWRRDRLLAWCLLVFVVLWLPVSNTVLVVGTIMAERLMYLPSVAFALLVGAFVAHLRATENRFSRWVASIAVVVAAVHIGLAIDRNRDWRSQEILFRSTVERSPNSAKAQFNYGIVLQAQGRDADASDHFRAALQIAPDYPEANNALGTLLLAQQDLSGAEERFRAALRSNAGLATAWTNLGTVLFRSGKDDDARQALERAVRLNPTLGLARATLGAIAERKGDRVGAIEHYRKAYRLAPTFEGLGAHLAELLIAAGHRDEAQLVLQDLRQRAPLVR